MILRKDLESPWSTGGCLKNMGFSAQDLGEIYVNSGLAGFIAGDRASMDWADNMKVDGFLASLSTFFVLFRGPCRKTGVFSVVEGGCCGKQGRRCGKDMVLRGIVDKRLRKGSFLLRNSGFCAIDHDLSFITLVSINHRKFAVDN